MSLGTEEMNLIDNNGKKEITLRQEDFKRDMK
jgi:hypothetical protein